MVQPFRVQPRWTWVFCHVQWILIVCIRNWSRAIGYILWWITCDKKTCSERKNTTNQTESVSSYVQNRRIFLTIAVCFRNKARRSPFCQTVPYWTRPQATIKKPTLFKTNMYAPYNFVFQIVTRTYTRVVTDLYTEKRSVSAWNFKLHERNRMLLGGESFKTAFGLLDNASYLLTLQLWYPRC